MIICPAAARSSTFQRTSAPYPWLRRPEGAGSPPSRFHPFFAGSLSGVTVIAAADFVLSTVRTAAFHVPKTAWGGIGVQPCCQSPAVLFGAELMSVMKGAGNIGRAHRAGAAL